VPPARMPSIRAAVVWSAGRVQGWVSPPTESRCRLAGAVRERARELVARPLAINGAGRVADVGWFEHSSGRPGSTSPHARNSGTSCSRRKFTRSSKINLRVPGAWIVCSVVMGINVVGRTTLGSCVFSSPLCHMLLFCRVLISLFTPEHFLANRAARERRTRLLPVDYTDPPCRDRAGADHMDSDMLT